MFGKLLKYDLRSMFKTCVPLWLALLAVAVINRFTVHFRSDSFLGALPTVVFMIFYVALVIAAVMVSMVLIVTRFYNGLLKDEGYLMFTLPVKPWQLVISKGVTATIVSILSTLVAIVSVVLVSSSTEAMRQFCRELWGNLPKFTGEMWLCVVLSFLTVIATVVASVTHIYAALAIGHLASKHRIGYAVLAYIGINMVMTAIGMTLAELLSHTEISIDLDFINPFHAGNIVLTIVLVLTLIVIAIYYFITERILTKRLNLE
ncbi:MAG: hypothetical protein HFF17_00130 [Oscillospiraceae bacterium]|nr:hypothetical protein [Oscillospiraceae bacterium]